MRRMKPFTPLLTGILGQYQAHKLVVFRPHFISSPEQAPEDAQISLYYAMTIEQAKELRLAQRKVCCVLAKV